MGGRQLISRVELKTRSQGLVELGTDWFDKHDGLQALHSRILKVKDKTVETTIPRLSSNNWARWLGGVVKHIYTDGSHALDKTLGQFLLGKGKTAAGGAIILSDGVSCGDGLGSHEGL